MRTNEEIYPQPTSVNVAGAERLCAKLQAKLIVRYQKSVQLLEGEQTPTRGSAPGAQWRLLTTDPRRSFTATSGSAPENGRCTLKNCETQYSAVVKLCPGDGCATQILSNDLQAAAELLMKALMLRALYMVWSLQKFPRVTARCLRMLLDEDFVPALIDDEVLNEILRGSATDASQGQAPNAGVDAEF